MIRDVTGRWTKMRRRFGIAAPRVAIHSQIPWYWRWIGLAVLFGIRLLEAPSDRRAMALGIVIGIGLLTKYTMVFVAV